MPHRRRSLLKLLPLLVLALVVAGCAGKTTGATNVTSGSATLNAQGSCASGEKCRFYWEYWKSGQARSQSIKTAPSATINGPVGQTAIQTTISSLAASQTYRWVVCGSPNDGASYACVGPNGKVDGATADPPSDFESFTTKVAASDPVVMAAGDVACASAGSSSPGLCSQVYTSNLLLSQKSTSEGLAAVLAPGDLQYEDGTLSDFRSYFGPSWGRLGTLLRPAPGNHEYQTSGASGYFDYFASIGVPTGARGQGWYSFDIGSWHLISLNSSDQCSPVSCLKGSAQETFLRNDLAATTKPCILAYWHHPLASAPKLKDMFQDLYDAGADFVLVGHDHTYRAPKAIDATGAADPNGPRQVVVGTGGKSGGKYGVLKLTLHSASADWLFVGSGATDSGSATCHTT